MPYTKEKAPAETKGLKNNLHPDCRADRCKIQRKTMVRPCKKQEKYRKLNIARHSKLLVLEWNRQGRISDEITQKLFDLHPAWKGA